MNPPSAASPLPACRGLRNSDSASPPLSTRASPSPGGGGSARGARRGGVTCSRRDSPPPASPQRVEDARERAYASATSPLQGEVTKHHGLGKRPSPLPLIDRKPADQCLHLHPHRVFDERILLGTLLRQDIEHLGDQLAH